MKRPPLPSLTGSQVRSLLLVASDARLQSTAPSNTNVTELEELLADLSRARGASRADLLKTATDATTPVPELIRIKDLAKLCMTDASDSPHREAARLLYHSAVAVAFLHHATAISGRPMHKQQDLYERFAATWAGHPIGELFRDAAARIAATPRPGRHHPS